LVPVQGSTCRGLPISGNNRPFRLFQKEDSMLKKTALIFALPVLLVCIDAVHAQQLYKFLGPKHSDEIKFSPKYKIPYNDNGFDDPLKHKWKPARDRGAPDWVLDEIKDFPGSPDAIGQWIDEAWDDAVAAFTKCGWPLADFAARVSPESLWGGVRIAPTIWYEPALDSYLAGGYYPDTRSIRVVNIYYGTTGSYRHARELLKWEMKNHFGTLAGIQSEPFSPDWPCNAR
jgi:hypothetical protein